MLSRIHWDPVHKVATKITKPVQTKRVLLVNEPFQGQATAGQRNLIQFEERAQIHHTNGTTIRTDTVEESYSSKDSEHFIAYQRNNNFVVRHNDKKTALFDERVLLEHQRKPTLLMMVQQPEYRTPACEPPAE
jgi:hypothetical protein